MRHWRTRYRLVRAALLAAGLSAPFVEQAGATFFSSSWVGGATGSWLVPANWSPTRIPSNSPAFSNEYAVTIAQPAGVNVIFNNVDITIDSLSLSAANGSLLVSNHNLTINNADGKGLSIGPNASIQVDPNGTMTFVGGVISVGSGGTIVNNGGAFNFGGDVTTQGGGTIVLLPQNGGILQPQGTLTNGLTIKGANAGIGLFQGDSALVNQSTGIIDADGSLGIPSSEPSFNVNLGANSSNAGTLMAENGGFLNIGATSPATFVNTGTIVALAGSEVSITGFALSTSGNGQLTTVGSGSISLGGLVDGTASPLILKGNIDFGADSVGTIANSGTMTGSMFLADNTTLTGSGVFTVHANGPVVRVDNSSGATLTNRSTINGYGQIGAASIGSVSYGTFALVNAASAVIDANVSSQSMELSLGPNSSNAGTLRASNGGELDIERFGNSGVGTFTNSGTIAALDGSSVEIDLIHLIGASGGVLTTGGSGTFTLFDSTLDGTSSPVVNTGTLLGNGRNIVQGTLTNNGAILLGSTQLLIDTNATLNGSGILSLGPGSGANIGAVAGVATLTNSSTINGAGLVSGDPSDLGLGSLNVVNTSSGLIDANVAAQTLRIQSPLVSNAGILRTTNGATLEITSALTNTGTADVAGGTAFHNGAWDQPGITSSLAAADSSHRTGVGYRVAGASYTFVYGLYGDTDLNSAVNTADFMTMAQHFGQSGINWIGRDFNYDGVVNAMDFNMLATAYGTNLPAVALGALVPEPVMLSLLLLPILARRCQRARL